MTSEAWEKVNDSNGLAIYKKEVNSILFRQKYQILFFVKQSQF